MCSSASWVSAHIRHSHSHPCRRLNWQLHFGEPPRWSSSVKFVLLDVEPSDQDAAKSAVVLRGDAGTGASTLLSALHQGAPAGAPLLPAAAASGWLAALQGKVAGAREKLAAKMTKTAFPLDYHTTLRVVRDELNRLPQPAVVVSEGANTMDNARWERPWSDCLLRCMQRNVDAESLCRVWGRQHHGQCEAGSVC